jgi:hexokinase
MNSEELRNKVADLLRKTSMDADSLDTIKLMNAFIGDMETGLAGKPSSLPMIPTYIEPVDSIPHGEKVIAMDAGGTNLRAALVSFDNHGKPVIEHFRKTTMPGIGTDIDYKAFFQAFADFIADLAPLSNRIGFCFSFPANILPNRDGQVIELAKEIKADGIEGKIIGEELNRCLKKTGTAGDHKVVIVNDTVADCLAGLAARPDRKYSGAVGFILGTGINACYIEKNAMITKIKDQDPNGSQIINLECGFFNKMPQGEADRQMDAKTVKPGSKILEKMISGVYFGKICSEMIKTAAAGDLFSPETARALIAGDWTTADVDRYLHNPYGSSSGLAPVMNKASEKDKVLLYHLINGVLERTARFTAIAMAAIIRKTDGGRNPLEPVCLAIDGTTFHRFFDFRFRVESCLRDLLGGDDHRYYEIIQVEDAPLIGAALAGLTD